MRRASSITEYAVLVSILALALVMMFQYLTRAVNGRWRQTADSFGYGLQYQPGKTNVTVTEGTND